MRKSIFDIAAQNIDMPSEVDRIITMATKEKILVDSCYNTYTLFSFVDEYCFADWKQRGHFLNVKDFLKAIDYNSILAKANVYIDSFLILIELVYNFWYLSELNLSDDSTRTRWQGNYYHLKDVMDDILAQYNHIAFADEDEGKILVIEDKPEVTACAEIITEELSGKVIRYNHRTLKGDLGQKRNILLSMGNDLEPKRKVLKQINGGLEETIFQLLNKLSIRHNNRDKGSKGYYIDYVAKMTDDELEDWYDELYQMMLLAFLQLDNTDRLKKTKELLRNLSGGNP